MVRYKFTYYYLSLELETDRAKEKYIILRENETIDRPIDRLRQTDKDREKGRKRRREGERARGREREKNRETERQRTL